MLTTLSDSSEPPLIAQARQALNTLKRVTWLTKKLLAPRAYQAMIWVLASLLLVALNPATSVQAMNAAGSTSDSTSLADFSFTSYEDITPSDVEVTLQAVGFATKPTMVTTEMGKPEKDLINRKQQIKQAEALAAAARQIKRKPITGARTNQTGISTAVSAAESNSNGNTYGFGYCTWWAKSKRPDLPNQLGNAGRWLSSAQSLGLDTGHSPKTGAIVVTSESAIGHVGYVEAVEGDEMIVSDMNMLGRGKISKRRMSIQSSVIKGFVY